MTTRTAPTARTRTLLAAALAGLAAATFAPSAAEACGPYLTDRQLDELEVRSAIAQQWGTTEPVGIERVRLHDKGGDAVVRFGEGEHASVQWVELRRRDGVLTIESFSYRVPADMVHLFDSWD